MKTTMHYLKTVTAKTRPMHVLLLTPLGAPSMLSLKLIYDCFSFTFYETNIKPPYLNY